MFTLVITRPVAKSICDGTPMPTATGWPAREITSRAASSISSTSASPLESIVGRSCISSRVVPETAAAATFVPPTSTPTLSSVKSFFFSTRGCETPPDDTSR